MAKPRFMRSILLSTNPSFSFFYTKRKLVDTHTFFWIKVHRKFQYQKNPFCFLFICDGVPAVMVFCAVEKAKATATFGMPVSTSLSYSHYLQIVLISIRQKKEVIQQKRKSWMCHHFSFWFTMKECKKIKRISKIGLPRFLLT